MNLIPDQKEREKHQYTAMDSSGKLLMPQMIIERITCRKSENTEEGKDKKIALLKSLNKNMILDYAKVHAKANDEYLLGNELLALKTTIENLYDGSFATAFSDAIDDALKIFRELENDSDLSQKMREIRNRLKQNEQLLVTLKKQWQKFSQAVTAFEKRMEELHAVHLFEENIKPVGNMKVNPEQLKKLRLNITEKQADEFIRQLNLQISIKQTAKAV